MVKKNINTGAVGRNLKPKAASIAVVGGRNVPNVQALTKLGGVKKGNSMRTKGV